MAPPRTVTLVETSAGCLEWQGCVDSLGYGKCGRFVDGVKYHLAHRWAWAEENGPIPDGLLVCHRCDNPRCCNVEHMFLGTDAENVADREVKGRGLKGRSRYSDDDVAEMARLRAGGMRVRRIGQRFGCTGTHVTWLLRNRSQ